MVLPQGLVILAQNPSSDVKGPAYALLLHLTYHPFGVKVSPPLFLLMVSISSTLLRLSRSFWIEVQTLPRWAR